MHQKLCCVLLFLPVFSYAENAAATHLQTQLNALHTDHAQFIQTTVDDQNAVLQKSEGELWIQRPGKFRWQVKMPNQQIIVLNGNTLSIYDVDLAQVTEQKLSAQQIDFSPASLLSGTGVSLTKTFSIAENADHSFTLIPKQSHNSINKVQVYFSQGKLVQLNLWNQLGQKNIYQFSKIEWNRPITASMFQLSIPKGVDVLRS